MSLVKYLHNRLALLNLNTQSIDFFALSQLPSLPELLVPGKIDCPPLALTLSSNWPDALIFYTGPCTGSFLPGSHGLGICIKAEEGLRHLPVAGHAGLALRTCGLDALVIVGQSKKPLVLRIGYDFEPILSLEPLVIPPKENLTTWRQVFGGNGQSLILTKPHMGSHPALNLEIGQAPQGSWVAQDMLDRNLTGIVLKGGGPLPMVPGKLNNALSEYLKKQTPLSPLQTLSKVISLLDPSLASCDLSKLNIGRPIGCCPSPCRFWLSDQWVDLKAQNRILACTNPLALAKTLEKESASKAIEGLIELVQAGQEPDFVPAYPWAEPEILGLSLGICPILLRRFPELIPLLQTELNHD